LHPQILVLQQGMTHVDQDALEIHLCLSHAQEPDIDQSNTLMLLLIIIQPKNKRKTHHRNQVR
jgi:hypothetical protein